MHWHGLRLENRYDGTHETQAPIPVGESFTYQVHVPDPGAYWYHPHIREDYGQEMGLYGNILVTPSDADYWPPANRELLLTLDDILIEDGQIAAFSESETTHVAMGRFGNVMLVAGEPDLSLEAKRGEVVRFYFTNTANTRVFNVALPGAQMKLVGADAATTSARSSSKRYCSRRPSVSSSTCCFRTAGRARARTPNARAHLPACVDHVGDEQAGAVARRGVRTPARQPRHGRATRTRRAVLEGAAGQDTLVRRRDGHGRARRRPGGLRLPDAPRSGERRAWQLPEVRDEAARGKRQNRRRTCAPCIRR